MYPFGRVLGWLAFADAGSIPHFSRASGNPLLLRVAVSQRFTSRRISVGGKRSPEDSACIVQSKLGFFEVHGFFPRASILQPSLGKLSLSFLDVLINAVEVLGGVVVHRSKVPDATPFGKWWETSRLRTPVQFRVSQGRLRAAISAKPQSRSRCSTI